MTVLRYVIAVVVLLGLTGFALVVVPLLASSAALIQRARRADIRTRQVEAQMAILRVEQDTERRLWSAAIDSDRRRSR
ncbi:MAG: hypothetical protein ACJ74O_02805 [Frankiaceae bacterium]